MVSECNTNARDSTKLKVECNSLRRHSISAIMKYITFDNVIEFKTILHCNWNELNLILMVNRETMDISLSQPLIWLIKIIPVINKHWILLLMILYGINKRDDSLLYGYKSIVYLTFIMNYCLIVGIDLTMINNLWIM